MDKSRKYPVKAQTLYDLPVLGDVGIVVEIDELIPQSGCKDRPGDAREVKRGQEKGTAVTFGRDACGRLIFG
jgi:hypothetical protein